MTTKDKARLRDLACKYAEYAKGKPMAQRREKWRVHNGLIAYLEVIVKCSIIPAVDHAVKQLQPTSVY